MIGFVLVGTNDLNRAMCFYNEICASLGAKRLYQMTNGCVGVVYGAESGPTLGVVQPFDGRPATSGNGIMVALPAASPEGTLTFQMSLSLGADKSSPERLGSDKQERRRASS